ncbi:MAG: hypothetical protein ACOC80_14775 [Petrotogales bacterium]
MNNDVDLREFMNENDPIDKLILEMVEKGELKVGLVEVKADRWHFFKKFMPNFLSH